MSATEPYGRFRPRSTGASQAPVLDEDPPGMIDDGHRLLVPIALPLGVEEAAVVDAVVKRLEAVASMISESES